MGFWTAVALVVGNIIGSGVFLLPASLAPYGGLAFGGWLISGAGAVMLALVFARLARANPAAGGIYAYSRAGFGDLAGFLVGWGYWTSIWSGCAALAVAFVGYVGAFLPNVAASPMGAAALAIAALWAVVIVNVRGVREAGLVQIVTTVVKLLPLVVIGGAGLIWFTPANFAVPAGATPGGFAGTTGTLFAIASLTLWALLGTESATIPAGAVDTPERTIPRATVVGALIAVLVSVISTAGVMGLLGHEALSHTTAPFADAARQLFGDRAAGFVAIAAAISVLGALNGWTLLQGQLPVAVAADGLFPTWFGRVSGRGTPVNATVAGGVLATLLIVANYSRSLVALFTFVIQLATLSTLVPYVFCSLAALMKPGGRTVPILAFAFSMAAIYGAGPEVVFWGFILLLAGLPLYVAQRIRAH
ncbi:MAG: amino acid permease [Acidobacteria bacterium]|nr:MAG: amino acid permease [Acidobacteriota bacterium]